MLLNQYGTDGLVFQILATGFKEAHLQDKLKFQVAEADKVGAKFKEAVKNAYNAKFLDDADMVIGFQIPKQEAPVEQPNDEQGQEEQAQKDQAPDNQPEDNGNDANAEGNKENAEPEKKEPEQNGEEQSDKGDENQDQNKDDGKGDEKKEEVKEAETSATGADLKKKIIDTVARCLYQEDKNKVELSDLDGYKDGYDVCFIKVSLKEDDTKQPPPQEEN